MKRTLALILALLMVLSLAVGCGSTEADAPADDQVADAPAADAPAADEPAADEPAADEPAAEPEATGAEEYTLPLTTTGESLSMMYSTHPLIFQWIEDVSEQQFYQEMQKRTGVEIEFVTLSFSEAAQEFSVIIASGEYPDLFYGMKQQFDPYGGLDYAIDEEIILDLTDLVAQYGYYYQQAMETVSDYRAAFYTDAGYMGQMIQIGETDSPATSGFCVRKDWLDELGMDIPVTIEDYTEVMRAFKSEYNTSSAFFAGSTALNPMWSVCYDVLVSTAIGGPTSEYDPSMYQVDGVVKFPVIEEGFRSAVEDARLWYSEGLIADDFFTITDGDAELENLISTDDTGIFVCNSVTNLTVWKNNLASSEDFELVGIANPRLSEDQVLHFRHYDPIVNPLRGMSISTTCENVELAVKWCDYSYSEEGSLLANYGVEGVSFEYVEGKPQLTEVITNNPDGIGMNFALSLYCMQNGNFVIDYYRAYSTYNDNERTAVELWSEDDYTYLIPDGVTLTPDESEIYSSTVSDIKTYINENYLLFITGEKSMDEFDAFVQQVKDMGIQDAIDVYQAALDRYNAR